MLQLKRIELNCGTVHIHTFQYMLAIRTVFNGARMHVKVSKFEGACYQAVHMISIISKSYSAD
jgi:hypothetical protein